MRRRIEPLAPSHTPIHILPNGVNIEELRSNQNGGLDFRRTFIPEAAFVVLHAGNMGNKQDLAVLLRTAWRLRHHEDIHFCVVGDGATKATFLRERDSRRLQNVSHLPPVAPQYVANMLQTANAVVILQRKEMTDTVVPSKLISAMAAGAAIVATCSPTCEAARILLRSQGGIGLTARTTPSWRRHS